MKDVYKRWKDAGMFDKEIIIKQYSEVLSNDCIGNDPEIHGLPIARQLINSLPKGTDIVSIVKPPPSSTFIVNSTSIGVYEDDGSISLLNVENDNNFAAIKEYTKWLILNKNKNKNK